MDRKRPAEENVIDLTNDYNNNRTNDESSKSNKNTSNQSPPAKRARRDERNNSDSTNGNNPLVAAKSRLSKWASRLFDPNRPRGVIEPPQVIPLNDEFLQQFGKREKEYDKALGKDALEIDNEILNEDDDQEEEEDQDNNNEAAGEGDSPKNKKKKKKKAKEAKGKEKQKQQGHQVKINNLKYTTTEERLQTACEQEFGQVLKVVMLADEGNTELNRGWALVTFAEEDAAAQCLSSSNTMTLDGRPLRFEKALERSSSSSNNNARYFLGGGAAKGGKADLISVKCFRCGNAGHREASCTQPPKPKPCPLCADTETHSDPRNCPIKAICFNCGVPGHVSRYCTQRRGMQPLSMCTLCFESGHTKYQCQHSYPGAPPPQSAQDLRDVVCMVCGQAGHFCCRPLCFESGWNGLTCGNCGLPGHVLKQCRRPGLDDLVRDDTLALQEIQSSAASLLSSPNANAEARGRQSSFSQRPSQQQQYNNEDAPPRHRAKSAPPPRNRDLRRFHSMPEQGRYDEPPPPPPPPPPRYDSMPPRHERHEAPAPAPAYNNNTGRGYPQPERGRPRNREPPRRQHSSDNASFGRSRSGGGGGRFRGSGR